MHCVISYGDTVWYAKSFTHEVVDPMTSSGIINTFRSYCVIRDTPAQISNDLEIFFGRKNYNAKKGFSSVAHGFVNYWTSIGLFSPQKFCGEMGQVRPILMPLISSFKMIQNFKLALWEFKTLIDSFLITTGGLLGWSMVCNL